MKKDYHVKTDFIKTAGDNYLDKLPLTGAAPEWHSEKEATITFYEMASGIFTALGVMPSILGSKNVTALATSG